MASVTKAGIVRMGEGTFALWQSLVDVDLVVLCVYDGGVAHEHEVDWISTDRTWCFLNEPYDSLEEMIDTLTTEPLIHSVSGGMIQLGQPAMGCSVLNSQRALLWSWGGSMDRKMIQNLIKMASLGDYLFRASSKEGQVVLSINDNGECVHYPVVFNYQLEKWVFAEKKFNTLRQLTVFLEEEPVKSSRGQPDFLIGQPALGGTVHDVEHMEFGVMSDPSPHVHRSFEPPTATNTASQPTEDDEYEVVDNGNAPPPPSRQRSDRSETKMVINDAFEGASGFDEDDSYELPVQRKDQPPPRPRKSSSSETPPEAPIRHSLKRGKKPPPNPLRSESDLAYELPNIDNSDGFTGVNPMFAKSNVQETNLDSAANTEEDMYTDADDAAPTDVRTVTVVINRGDKVGAALNTLGANYSKFFTKISEEGEIGKSNQIFVGDEVVSVNGHNLYPLAKDEAVSFLKTKGEVVFQIRENVVGYKELYDARQQRKRTNSAASR